MDRADVTTLILSAKRHQKLTFTEIAERLDVDRVWLTTALHGQHPLPAGLAARVTELLELPAEATAILEEIPTRGH
jgi:cyanate lyase